MVGPRGPHVKRTPVRPLNGIPTVLAFQVVGDTRYFDAAGTAGKTLGLGR